MMHYLRDPERIHQQSYAKIRELADLSRFTPEQQQLVIHLIQTRGDLGLAHLLQFTPNTINAGRKAIKCKGNILYDEFLVEDALDRKLLYQEPLGFINRASVISHAKASKQTRAMTAVDYWVPFMNGSIVLIGQSGTALFRLLELIKEGAPRPALIIASPRGFINAEASKQWLWKVSAELDLDCIVVTGPHGGGVLAATAMNALLMMHNGIYI